MEQKLTLYVDLLPVGAIILWYGEPSTLPDGWALCNGVGKFGEGRYNIPDLQGQFVRGCMASETPGTKGGQDTVKLTAKELPSHRHTIKLRDRQTVDSRLATSQLMASVAYNRGISASEGAVNIYDRGGEKGNAIPFQEAFQNFTEHALEMTEEGGGKPVMTVPAYTALYYLIKVR